MGREELEALVRTALEEATQRGVDQAEVAVGRPIQRSTLPGIVDWYRDFQGS